MSRINLIILAFLLGFSGIQAQDNMKIQLGNDIDSLSYSLGLLIGVLVARR